MFTDFTAAMKSYKPSNCLPSASILPSQLSENKQMKMCNLVVQFYSVFARKANNIKQIYSAATGPRTHDLWSQV